MYEKQQAAWDLNRVIDSELPANTLGVKAGAVIEGFLCSHTCRGQGCVEIGAANRFRFGHSLAQKHGETADEGVACPGTVDGADGERRHMFAAVAACEKRSIGS